MHSVTEQILLFSGRLFHKLTARNKKNENLKFVEHCLFNRL